MKQHQKYQDLYEVLASLDGMVWLVVFVTEEAEAAVNLVGPGDVLPEMSARLSSRRALLASVLKSVTVFALVRPPTGNEILAMKTILSLTRI